MTTTAAAMRRLLNAIATVGALLATLALAPVAAQADDPCPNAGIRSVQRSGALPDCRAYEMVSPPDKNGGDIVGEITRVGAAATEEPGLPMAATFTSQTPFGNVQGTGSVTQYLSERDGTAGTPGWSTHGITPAQDAQAFAGTANALEPAYVAFSPELRQGVLQAWSPLTNDPNVAKVENLYRRNDVRAAGTGFYELLSACPGCETAGPLPDMTAVDQYPAFGGASQDLSRVVFESRWNLTADATGTGTKLYESSPSGVRLLSDPSASGCPGGSSCSIAGQGAHFTYNPHLVSDDGSKVVFTAPATDDGQIQEDYGATASRIYQLDDRGTPDPSDDTVTQVNASERTDCADGEPCQGTPAPDPDGAAPARFWAASADGSRVFFTSAEQLTNDPAEHAPRLYLWRRSPDAQGHHLLLMDVNHHPTEPTRQADGVMGASDDGHRVYFMTLGQLVNDPQLPTGPNAYIYLWRDDLAGGPKIQYVGELARRNDEDANLNPALSVARKTARVTPDGGHLVFEASDGTGLTGYDHGVCESNSNNSANGMCSEVYVYGADSRTLMCASCPRDGAPATADATLSAAIGVGYIRLTRHLNRAISDDGRRVFFTSAEALVPGDLNRKKDVYEFDTADRSLHLISSGQDDADSAFMDASADGTDVLFLTRERLVGWDQDRNYDMYDARAGGGFPNPAAAAEECSGEACRGAAAPPAAPPQQLASELIEGDGNVAQVRSHKTARRVICRKGFRKKKVHGHVRCVRKKKRARGRRTPRAARGSQARSARATPPGQATTPTAPRP
jgi:hypothetical protein